MSISLGRIQLEHPFVLAPMAGITNSPFRRLMREMGSSMVVSELVSANGLEFNNRRTKEMLYFHPSERPVGLQIFGENKEALVKACQYIESIGADFVDLNLGCPVPKVVKKGAGSAMCRNPVQLNQILSAMVKSVKIPVSIKIRSGWNSEEKNAHEVVKAAADAGVEWVGVHGRTRAQAYEGEADWNFIAEIKSRSSIPIIGNGDLTTPQKAVQKLKESSVDAVYIGRGALRNPFIFSQSKELLETGKFEIPTVERYEELLLMQKAYLKEEENLHTSLVQSKKFLSWYSAGYPNSHEFRKNIFQLKEFEEVWDFGLSFFKEKIQNRNWKFLEEAFLMGGHG